MARTASHQFSYRRIVQTPKAVCLGWGASGGTGVGITLVAEIDPAARAVGEPQVRNDSSHHRRQYDQVNCGHREPVPGAQAGTLNRGFPLDVAIIR